MVSVVTRVWSASYLELLMLFPAVCWAYLFIWIIYARWIHPLRNIPGPFLASVSRLWVIWRVHRGDMECVQRSLHEKYGPLIRIAPNEVACAEPDAIKHIYPTQSPLTKTDFYPAWHNKTFSEYPDHFSGTDERTHSERRRIVNHVYSLSNVLKSEEYIDKCSLLFAKKVGEYADQGKVLDLGEWLQWYAFDAVGELFFGEMFGFMQNSADYQSYIASLDILVPVLAVVAVAPSYARPLILMSSIVNPLVRTALKAIDHIAAAARNCVNRRVETDAEQGPRGPRRDILQQLLDIREEKGEKVDFGIQNVQMESYTALFAGSDTTSIATKAVFYFLLKNPQIYEQVQREIDAATANRTLSTPPRYSESVQLPLLSGSIKEAMRLHPSVGLTMPRIVPKGGLTVGGQHIPEGYRVGMNGAVVHYDKGVFGPDADSFRPQRWLDGDAKKMDKYMLHFGAGTRTCIGKNISLSEIHKLVPFVLQKFELKLEDPEKSWTTDNKWFNKQTGLDVLVKRRG